MERIIHKQRQEFRNDNTYNLRSGMIIRLTVLLVKINRILIGKRLIMLSHPSVSLFKIFISHKTCKKVLTFYYPATTTMNVEILLKKRNIQKLIRMLNSDIQMPVKTTA
jgi:hypothetical protein